MPDTQTTNDEIGTLIDQLQSASAAAKKVPAEPDLLKKEQMEKFVVEKAGELVKESLDFMKSMKDFVASAPNGEDVSAIANLITATSSAIDSLNKLIVTDKKIDAAVKIKEMDIASKKEIADSNNDNRLQLTREEIFRKLLETRPPVSAEVIDVSANQL
jgi:hypothetical protein